MDGENAEVIGYIYKDIEPLLSDKVKDICANHFEQDEEGFDRMLVEENLYLAVAKLTYTVDYSIGTAMPKNKHMLKFAAILNQAAEEGFLERGCMYRPVAYMDLELNQPAIIFPGVSRHDPEYREVNFKFKQIDL